MPWYDAVETAEEARLDTRAVERHSSAVSLGSAGNPHVRLIGVTKRFGSNPPAVDNVSLEVPRGSFTTFLGPSGCGKTTTLRLIAGFYDPEAGDLFIGDRRINDVPAHRRGAAMVFQDYALFPHMSVEENVAYGLKVGGVARNEVKRRVGEALSFVGLSGLERRSPNQLSGGQQQRVALARAIVMNPVVLLLDEPLSNLDAKLRVSIRSELIAIQRDLGLTTIYVTHDQDEALAMSDWIAVMNRGKVIQWGTPADIYYRPRTPFMADFVGAVNLLRATLISTESATVRVRLGEVELEVPRPVELPALAAGDEVLLSIRPEGLGLQPPGRPAQAGSFALRGIVRRRTFLGHLMRYSVAIGGQEWLVDLPDPGAQEQFEGDVDVIVTPRRFHLVPERDPA